MDPTLLDLFYAIVTVIMLFFVGNSMIAFKNQRKINKATGGTIRAVKDRMFASATKSVALSMFALLGFNRILDWYWNPIFVIATLVSGMVIVGLPSLYWNFLYYTDRFGDRQKHE